MRPGDGSDRDMNDQLRALIARGAGVEGVTPSSLPGIVYFRSSEPRPRQPLLFDPSLCLVASGAKRAYVGSETYTYDPLTYLVLCASLPIDCEIIRATRAEPFLSVVIDIDIAALAELVVEMEPIDPIDAAGPPGRKIFTARVDTALLGAVVRLLTLLEQPEEARLFGPAAVREVWFRALRGKEGPLLRAAALEDDRSHDIERALRYVRRHYREPITVGDLAREARMGSSSFHSKFKRVTSLSPMQYVRRLRLQEARRLMLHDGMSAEAAGRQVGYESPSHFNREFKRLFGQPPHRHVADLRSRL